jgi:hypothetical protein
MPSPREGISEGRDLYLNWWLSKAHCSPQHRWSSSHLFRAQVE